MEAPRIKQSFWHLMIYRRWSHHLSRSSVRRFARTVPWSRWNKDEEANNICRFVCSAQISCFLFAQGVPTAIFLCFWDEQPPSDEYRRVPMSTEGMLRDTGGRGAWDAGSFYSPYSSSFLANTWFIKPKTWIVKALQAWIGWNRIESLH